MKKSCLRREWKTVTLYHIKLIQIFIIYCIYILTKAIAQYQCSEARPVNELWFRDAISLCFHFVSNQKDVCNSLHWNIEIQFWKKTQQVIHYSFLSSIHPDHPLKSTVLLKQFHKGKSAKNLVHSRVSLPMWENTEYNFSQMFIKYYWGELAVVFSIHPCCY